MGPTLRDALLMAVGRHATMGKSEIVFGLAAIVTQLGLTHCRECQDLFSDWQAQWDLAPASAIGSVNGKKKSREPLDMFKLLQRQMESEFDELKHGSTHGALWMLSLDETRCSSILEVFKSHAVMSTFLAEGVLVALESWNRSMPEASPTSTSSSAAGTAQGHSTASLPETAVSPTVIYPAVFGSPNLHAQRWLNWKSERQGREKEGGSTYTLLQINRKPNRQVRRRRPDTHESASASASDAEPAMVGSYVIDEIDL
jgi:hypothetical protein